MSTTVRSFSKINLGLAIGPVRADGFHWLTTLYQTLAAHDLVTVTLRPAAATRVSLTCNDQRVPCDERNTAYQAALLALRSANITADVSIHIEKRLPVQGGLGAGSANAAAALIALERELRVHGMTMLSRAERLQIAAEVGSDVPLFLIGGAVLGLGHGEEVYPMPDFPVTPCVLALPEIGVSTPEAFREWDARHEVGPESLEGHPERDMRAPFAFWNVAAAATPAVASQLTPAPPSSRLNTLSRSLASAFCEPHSSGVFASGADLVLNPLLALVRTGIENDFEAVVFPQNPLFGEIKRVLAISDRPELAAVCAALSGSGSVLFGLYATRSAADAAEERLAKLGVRSMRTETLPREAYWQRMMADEAAS
ncbi:MAG: 4-(cytidine 5'-diphospho)-2-C-methyl-D-erythritol kinase [Acidobacteriaceae bacterium]